MIHNNFGGAPQNENSRSWIIAAEAKLSFASIFVLILSYP